MGAGEQRQGATGARTLLLSAFSNSSIGTSCGLPCGRAEMCAVGGVPRDRGLASPLPTLETEFRRSSLSREGSAIRDAKSIGVRMYEVHEMHALRVPDGAAGRA